MIIVEGNEKRTLGDSLRVCNRTMNFKGGGDLRRGLWQAKPTCKMINVDAISELLNN